MLEWRAKDIAQIDEKEARTILEIIRQDVPEIAGLPPTTAKNRAKRTEVIAHVWEIDES